MPKKITLDLDDPLASQLEQTVREINEACKAEWTMETLAASFLEHMLIDDTAVNGATVH